MGAPYHRSRKPGTGYIRKLRWGRLRFVVHGPRVRGEEGAELGRFETEYRAQQALDKWLAETRGGCQVESR
jgi:hypothetical protein